MREWRGQLDALHETGAELLVLTADAPAVLEQAIAEQNLHALRFVPTEPATFDRYGLRNPRKPSVPLPTTFVVAADGTLIYREIHRDYKKRASAKDVVEVVRAWQRDGLTLASPAAVAEAGPDWASALSVTAARTADGARVELVVQPGFHLYGRKERVSVPLDLTVSGGHRYKVAIPPGTPVALSALGDAWLLTGTIALDVRARRVQGPLRGAVLYQLCTDAACSPPTQQPWAARP